jgi:hypothetical protein
MCMGPFPPYKMHRQHYRKWKTSILTTSADTTSALRRLSRAKRSPSGPSPWNSSGARHNRFPGRMSESNTNRCARRVHRPRTPRSTRIARDVRFYFSFIPTSTPPSRRPPHPPHPILTNASVCTTLVRRWPRMCYPTHISIAVRSFGRPNSFVRTFYEHYA